MRTSQFSLCRILRNLKIILPLLFTKNNDNVNQFKPDTLYL